MDENPYRSPETRGARRDFEWAKAKRWGTVAFLFFLGASGVVTGVTGFIRPLPWSGGGLQSATYAFMGLLALYAAYQHARQIRL